MLNFTEHDRYDLFLDENKDRKRAYICSPLSAGTRDEVIRNMKQARFYMTHAMDRMQVVARAPHAYLPMILCDGIPAERALALKFGLELLELSSILLVCGSSLTPGMKGEILHALSLKMPVVVFNHELYEEVREFAGTKNNRNISYSSDHPCLGTTDDIKV